MSEEAKSRRERLLTQLLAGDIGYDDEQVKEMLEKSHEFRAELEGLRRVHTRLKSEDAEREAVLDALEKEPCPALEADLESSFRKIAATPSGKLRMDDERSRSARKSRIWPLITAAAVLIALIWVPWGDVANKLRPASDQWLGDPKEIECLSPQGPVSDYGTFRWSPPTDLAIDSYRLRFLEKKASGEEVVFKELSRLRATEYTPAFELPDHIIWRVLGYNRSKAIIAQGEEEAYRIGR
ncbi:MAG: hypothetical protein ABIK28_13250 [Planctomycetota bacterium]